MVLVQNILHVAQTVAVQQRFRLGRGDLPACDLDREARIDDGNGQKPLPIQELDADPALVFRHLATGFYSIIEQIGKYDGDIYARQF